jgi:hypothetical protein
VYSGFIIWHSIMKINAHYKIHLLGRRNAHYMGKEVYVVSIHSHVMISWRWLGSWDIHMR